MTVFTCLVSKPFDIPQVGQVSSVGKWACRLMSVVVFRVPGDTEACGE